MLGNGIPDISLTKDSEMTDENFILVSEICLE